MLSRLLRYVWLRLSFTFDERSLALLREMTEFVARTSHCLRIAYYQCLAELRQTGIDQVLLFEQYFLRRVYVPRTPQTKELREFAALSKFCGLDRLTHLHA